MLCGDCPELDATRMRAMQPDWQPRAVCCCDEYNLAPSNGDSNAAMTAASLRERVPPGTPLNNRRQRRRAEAQLRRQR